MLLLRSVVFGAVALATAATLIAAPPQNKSRPAVGEKAPDFDLPIVGEDGFIELSDQYDQGAVVVIVLRGYPGYQCPICSQQVSSLANRAKALRQQAHRVILVYPGDGSSLERKAEQFLGSRSLPDPLVLVRDQDMKLVDRWGLRWKKTRETAYPATYVIDSNGRIRWSKVSDSHAGRSSVEEILRELRKL